MRVLLDTNILIHRETASVVREEIGEIFYWLDRIRAQKCIHPKSIEEIRRYHDSSVIRSFEIKLRSYHQLRTVARDSPEIAALRINDINVNDETDTDLIREVYTNRVDILLSEDRGVHRKAISLGIQDQVLDIETFLANAMRDHPDLVNYRVLSVKQQYFGDLNVGDSFFDSFKKEYPGFETWFNSKSDEIAYVCTGEHNNVEAFLYLKPEGPEEHYADIEPQFVPGNRMKIGTFKVAINGYNLGERFLKIIFDNALVQNVDEVYVTVFERSVAQICLIRLLESWGFKKHGTKTTDAGEEGVWVRMLRQPVSYDNPAVTYPYVGAKARKFIVPIWPDYHTELFPDSILNTESALDFIENAPCRNAIRKAYISRSFERDLRTGDIIVFYRTKTPVGPAHYTSVATTLGVVESVHTNLNNFDRLRKVCKGATVFSDDKLREFWDHSPSNRPFVVKFLYTYSFPSRPTLKTLKEAGVIAEAPRGFEQLSDEGFYNLLELANAASCPISD